VPLSASQVVAMLATGVSGVLPFCALGLLVGTLVKGQAAPGMVNLVYLPMAFLSGLWMPLSMLPKVLGRVAPVWPSWHLNALMQAAAGMHHGGVATHLLALGGFTAAFLLLAARRLRRHG
jgi:ABC-2 type transport system permease protein